MHCRISLLLKKHPKIPSTLTNILISGTINFVHLETQTLKALLHAMANCNPLKPCINLLWFSQGQQLPEHSKAHLLFHFSSKAFHKPFRFSVVSTVFTGLCNCPIFLHARIVLRSPKQFGEYHSHLRLSQAREAEKAHDVLQSRGKIQRISPHQQLTVL